MIEEEEKTLMMIFGQEGEADQSGGNRPWASKMIGSVAGVARGEGGAREGRREKRSREDKGEVEGKGERRVL